jgi:hypothetical protein
LKSGGCGFLVGWNSAINLSGIRAGELLLMTPPVFISYPQDGADGQALANELFQRLQAEGIPAFLDTESIRLGERWIQALSNGVKQCRVVLSVVSPASHDRPWVEKEYIEANKLRIPIIPVLATAGDVPFQMNDVQVARLYGDYKEKDWQRLLTRIREYLPDSTDAQLRKLETAYLEALLHDNEERALRFAGKVYAPLAVVGECVEHDDVIAAFSEQKRLVILGEPGAGKTFSLWRIAADYAQKALEQPSQILPVVIPLNRWDSPNLLLHDFVLEQLGGLASHFAALYQSKRLLPLFDALNEIPFDQREEKLPQVRAWLERYPTASVLLTCRLRDYRGPLEQELDRLTIEPLDPPRIHDFLHNYFAEDDADHTLAEKLFWQLAGGEEMRESWEDWKKRGHENHWEEFWTLAEIPEEWKTGDNEHWWDGSRQKYLNDSRSLMKLAANPYLLTQMVVIYSEQQQLPQSRFALFREFVADLIYREVQAKPDNHYPKAHQDELQVELKRLAWQLQSRTKSAQEVRTVLSRADAVAIMPLPRLEFAAAASLLELTRDSVRFSHQLLQEFFTAQSFEERRANGLQAKTLWPEQWWAANGWEEAAKLAAEYEVNPKPFLQWLAAGNPKLAAEIAREQGLLDDVLFAEFRTQWQNAITDIANYPNPHERHAISTVLAWLDWDNRRGLSIDDIDWVDIDGYKMSRYPVTNSQFQAFVADGGYENDEWWDGLQKPELKPDHGWKESNRPVENVSWYDAMAFCNWLRVKTGLKVSLPTEEQWEKAARCAEGRAYPWGNSYRTGYANINETWEYSKFGEYNLQETSAVGIYPQDRSPYGLMDTSGNVWEWCLNRYYKPEVIEPDLSGVERVFRGGSWGSHGGSCLSDFRSRHEPDTCRTLLGFRLALGR